MKREKQRMEKGTIDGSYTVSIRTRNKVAL